VLPTTDPDIDTMFKGKAPTRTNADGLTEFAPWDYGKTVFYGRSNAQKMSLMAVNSVLVMVEGGPGALKEAPSEMRGIRKFVEKHTHSPGDPADANKSDFKAFASSFRLPYWHSMLDRLRSLMGEVGEWWADACLGEAERGAAHHELERLFDVATGTGIDRDHPKLVRASRILSDRLADRVLGHWAQDALTKLTGLTGLHRLQLLDVSRNQLKELEVEELPNAMPSSEDESVPVVDASDKFSGTAKRMNGGTEALRRCSLATTSSKSKHIL